MQILIRKVRGRKIKPTWAGEVGKEIGRTFKARIGPDIRRLLNRIVSRWKNRPSFEIKFIRTKAAYGVWVRAKGKNAKIWNWVNRGTGLYGPRKRKYKIKPKKRATGRRKRTTLAFQTGYKPKTSPGGHYKGPGKATGPWVFPGEVMHPGIKPRKLEQHVARWYRKRFRRHMENAIRRGLRRA